MAIERQTVEQLRKARGWKQIDLAYHAGASLSTISNIESGQQQPRIALAQKIADALGVSLDAIEWKRAEVKRPRKGRSSPKRKPVAA